MLFEVILYLLLLVFHKVLHLNMHSDTQNAFWCVWWFQWTQLRPCSTGKATFKRSKLISDSFNIKFNQHMSSSFRDETHRLVWPPLYGLGAPSTPFTSTNRSSSTKWSEVKWSEVKWSEVKHPTQDWPSHVYLSVTPPIYVPRNVAVFTTFAEGSVAKVGKSWM
jgi:hypothetical protein